MAVVGNRSHRQFKMGDEIDVIVSAASKIKRTIDLEIILDSQNHSQNVRKHRRFR
jgi:exoribonuclease R